MERNLQSIDEKLFASRLSRRRFLAGTGAIAGGTLLPGLLAACGGEDEDEPDAESTSRSGSGAAGETPESTTGTASPAAGSGEPQQGGTVTFGNNVDASQLDPHLTSSAQEILMFYGLYNRLTRIDENLEVVPELSTGWTVADDGNSIIFELVEGVQFHDGTPCDAEAVKWNFDRIIDPESGSVIKGRVASVESVEALSPTEVQFNLTQPDAVLLTNVAYGSMAMISPTAFEERGEDFASNPVGTGPFTFVEWTRDDHVTLARNENYWEEGLPYLHEVIFRPIPDATVRLTNLRTGDIDVNFVVDPKDIETVEGDDTLVLWNNANPGHMGIRLNIEAEPFTDVKVRQAIAWAIDRDAVNQILFFGAYTPAYGPFDPETWAHDPEFKPYAPRDLDMARSLLEEAGYADGIEFTLTLASNPQTAQLAELLQAQLAEANITATPEAVERGVFLDGIVSREWTAYIDGVAGREDPNNYFAEHFVCGMQYNGQNYCNEEMDALLVEAASIYDQEERRPLYRQIEEMISEDCPMVFVYHSANTRAWNKRVEGLVLNPIGRMFYVGAYVTGE